MTEGSIHVTMCVDHGFSVPLAVSLASLDASSGVDQVTVDVLHPGIEGDTRSRVTRTLKNISVQWHEVDHTSLQGAYHTESLTPATLYRLIIGEVLGDQVTRTIYLDADTIVQDSLRELAGIELGRNILAAVRDAPSPWAAGPVGTPWRELGLEPSSPHLNAGVLVIDLARWRAEGVGERALEILRRTKPRWGDQDALNAVLEGQWVELPRRWNLQTQDAIGDSTAWALWPEDVKDALADPAIVHFTGLDKPWDADATHPLTQEWLHWLDQTSWSGWRPLPRQRGRLETLARSGVQAARRWRESRAPAPWPDAR